MKNEIFYKLIKMTGFNLIFSCPICKEVEVILNEDNIFNCMKTRLEYILDFDNSDKYQYCEELDKYICTNCINDEDLIEQYNEELNPSSKKCNICCKLSYDIENNKCKECLNRYEEVEEGKIMVKCKHNYEEISRRMNKFHKDNSYIIINEDEIKNYIDYECNHCLEKCNCNNKYCPSIYC